MHKTLFLFFLCTSFSLHAQIIHGKDDDKFRLFDVGLITGFNASQVDGDLYAGFYKIGINAGGSANINFNTNWSAGFEILFSQKGAHSNPTANNTNNTYNLTLNYAEVPVMINYNDQNRMLFSAGLAYGRLFGFKEVINGFENTNDDGAFYNDELSFHFGGTILVGEERHFGINFRYQGSITKIGVSANPKLTGAINRLLSFRGIYYF